MKKIAKEEARRQLNVRVSVPAMTIFRSIASEYDTQSQAMEAIMLFVYNRWRPPLYQLLLDYQHLDELADNPVQLKLWEENNNENG